MESSLEPAAATACFVTSVRVAFGDCDPAHIVYFPNFYRWLDQATHDLCEAAGFELTAVRRDRQWVGFPLAEAGARFHRPATINDLLRIETRIREWRRKVFLLEHRIVRDGVLLVEGWQTRFIGVHLAEQEGRLAALPLPQEFVEAVDRVVAAGA
jgi:4-hydroxybenzoyl-CoA thioesterase